MDGIFLGCASWAAPSAALSLEISHTANYRSVTYFPKWRKIQMNDISSQVLTWPIWSLWWKVVMEVDTIVDWVPLQIFVNLCQVLSNNFNVTIVGKLIDAPEGRGFVSFTLCCTYTGSSVQLGGFIDSKFSCWHNSWFRPVSSVCMRWFFGGDLLMNHSVLV